MSTITFNTQALATTEWFDVGDPVVRFHDESDPPEIWLVKKVEKNYITITNVHCDRVLRPRDVIKLT